MNFIDSKTNNKYKNALCLARLDLLIKQAPTAIISSFVLSLMIVFLLWNEVDQSVLITWIALSLSIGLARLLLNNRIKNKLTQVTSIPFPLNFKTYEVAFSIGIFLNGTLIGWLGLIIDPNWPVDTKFIIPFFITGMTAGALTSSSTSLMSYYCFISPILLMLSYGLFHIDMQFAAFLVIVYVFLMFATSKKINSAVVEGMLLRIQNLELIESLHKNNSKQAQLLQNLNRSERLFSGAFNQSGVSMGLINKHMKFFKVNQAACDLLGYSMSELIAQDLLSLSHKSEQPQSLLLFDEILSGVRQQFQVRKRYIKKDGNDIWVQTTLSAVYDLDGNFEYAVVHAQDINQEYHLNQQLLFLAQNDTLTKLPNRYAFEKQLQSLLEEQNDNEHVLCYIDLDQFKVINDTCGHAAGDELLQQVSRVLKQGLRKSDFLSRIGGDEFAVLMFGCSIESAIKQLEKLLSSLRNYHFDYENHHFSVGASLGLVRIISGSTMTEVLKQADSACYVAKKAGRDRLHVFDHDDVLLAQHTSEMNWVPTIQQALAEHKLILYSQEIVHTKSTNSLPHFELLIRMQGEDGKIIPPGMFLPAAEQYNLAATIDLWVVEQVIKILGAASSEGRNIEGIYGINLSGHSLGDKRFYDNIINLIRNNDFRSSNAYICFEITETAAVTNMTSALYFITELSKLGCQFALDDFGSGLSSFAYLKQMPVDYLKIDGMFVKDCLSDPVNLEMIKSINGIGHVMGLKTIAEFVENDEIFKKIEEIGVDYAQGYWNGPPKPWVL